MSSQSPRPARASIPVSEPSLAVRPPAELVHRTEEPPPSIRAAAHASRPPSEGPDAADAEGEEPPDPPASTVQPIATPDKT